MTVLTKETAKAGGGAGPRKSDRARIQTPEERLAARLVSILLGSLVIVVGGPVSAQTPKAMLPAEQCAEVATVDGFLRGAQSECGSLPYSEHNQQLMQVSAVCRHAMGETAYVKIYANGTTFFGDLERKVGHQNACSAVIKMLSAVGWSQPK
jgi:hypothetical protein